MNKLVKNRMLIISISLALLVLINIAVSYSYYLGKVVGNETTTTLSFTSAGVIIEYENNSGSITDTNITPKWSTTKNFKVKSTMKANEGNNNDSKLGYSVKMIVDSNDFPTNSIAYTLAQGSKTGNGQAMEAATDVGIATGANSEGIILGTGYFVVGDNEHNYTLTIKYMDSETLDGNKNFGIHLVVETVKAVTVRVDLNGGTYTGSTTKYIPLGLAVEIEQPTKDYHGFTGWIITSGAGSAEGNKILANSLAINVQAQYTKTPATINIDLNGGIYSGSTTINTTMGDMVDIGTPTKAGHIFTEWKIISGNGTVAGNKITAKSAAITVQAQYIIPTSFADDDWATIAAYVKANKEATASVYSVGSEKEVEIDMDDNGTPETYIVRIANNSNYDCTLDSKTACGFVVEFVDIVEQRAMNSDRTNVGGWPVTAMRTYLNGEFLAKLPSDLRSVIASTTVVSGHGSTSRETNFTSTDKIYLLSTAEVWTNGVFYDTSYGDTARSSTRQLDYYANNNVTTLNYSGAIKNYVGSAAWWWLRAASMNNNSNFLGAFSDGNSFSSSADASYGVAPAFRIE